MGTKRWLAVMAIALSGACAQASPPPGDDDDDDDNNTPTVDAAPQPGAPDAAVLPGTPDAAVLPGTPDAAVLPGTPDAAVLPGTPDATPPGTACDPVAQTGCDTSQKCAWLYTDLSTGAGVASCSANGTVGVGAACTSPTATNTPDDCVKGAHCVFGACKAICKIEPSTPCSAGTCIGMSLLDFDVCLPPCNPLTQDCPGTGEGCYLSVGEPVCATSLNVSGPGGACTYLNDCQAGSGCFDDTMGGGICYAYCDYAAHPGAADPTYCQAAETCGAVTGETLYGVCR